MPAVVIESDGPPALVQPAAGHEIIAAGMQPLPCAVRPGLPDLRNGAADRETPVTGGASARVWVGGGGPCRRPGDPRASLHGRQWRTDLDHVPAGPDA